MGETLVFEPSGEALWARLQGRFELGSGALALGMGSYRLFIVAVCVALALGLFHAADLGQWLTLAAVKGRQAELLAWRDAHPLLATGTFFAVYVAVTALSVARVVSLMMGAWFLFSAFGEIAAMEECERAIRTALEDVSAPYFGYPERRYDR